MLNTLSASPSVSVCCQYVLNTFLTLCLKQCSDLQQFLGRLDAEAEATIIWPPDAKSQLAGKDPDAGKD